MEITRRQLLKWLPMVAPVVAAIPLIAKSAPGETKRTTKPFHKYLPGHHHVVVTNHTPNPVNVKMTWVEFD